MIAGRFISLEGGEGCGKSTQSRLLASWLRQRGVAVTMTREPGGTDGAEAIRRLLLDPPGAGWHAPAEALLFAAARADHVNRVIRPDLAAGKWVVSDRFVDSSFAYQGVAGELGLDAVRMLHQIGSAGLLPDLTVLLQLSEKEASDRLALRDEGKRDDAIGGRGSAYHRRVADAFASLARGEPERFKVVDAERSVDEVHEDICIAVEPLLDHR